MNKTTIEILRDAREWLSDNDHWCKGVRWGVGGNSNCAVGALERACGVQYQVAYPAPPLWEREMSKSAINQLNKAAKSLIQDTRIGALLPPGSPFFITRVNDLLGWEATKEMFDLAIEAEQEEMDRQAKELVETCEEVLCLKTL